MPGHLGIQRRILLYVCAGLVLLLAAFFYLGMRAVDRATDQALEERRSMAQAIAMGLARDFRHLERDVNQQLVTVVPGSDPPVITSAVEDVFSHLDRYEAFPFFRVTRVCLFDTEGRLLALAQSEDMSSDSPPQSLFAQAAREDQAGRVFLPEAGPPNSFLAVAMPVTAGGKTWARAVVETRGHNSRQPFTPLGWSSSSRETGEARRSRPASGDRAYYLEVVADGRTALSIGSERSPGEPSPHRALIASAAPSAGTAGTIREVSTVDGTPDYVMAIVPVPGMQASLVLWQAEDVALAIPNRFQRDLFILGGLALAGVVSVAWVATRQVAKPLRELSSEAGRMAEGNLQEPISVRAQDEVRLLAENLESMRRQLGQALGELEAGNRELDRRVQERTQRLEEIVHRVITAQEEERRRVSLELHDETAQSLAALGISLDSVLRHRDGIHRGQIEGIMEARRLASVTLDGLRRVIQDLRPIALREMSLVAALRSYAQDTLERAGIEADVVVDGPERTLQEHVEIALYRVGQEALRNIHRHARAAHAWVTVTYTPSQISLGISDDGVGFDPERSAREPGGSVGLIGMQERASLLGGHLSIESRPGSGTTILMEVPTE